MIFLFKTNLLLYSLETRNLKTLEPNLQTLSPMQGLKTRKVSNLDLFSASKDILKPAGTKWQEPVH